MEGGRSAGCLSHSLTLTHSRFAGSHVSLVRAAGGGGGGGGQELGAEDERAAGRKRQRRHNGLMDEGFEKEKKGRAGGRPGRREARGGAEERWMEEEGKKAAKKQSKRCGAVRCSAVRWWWPRSRCHESEPTDQGRPAFARTNIFRLLWLAGFGEVGVEAAPELRQLDESRSCSVP